MNLKIAGHQNVMNEPVDSRSLLKRALQRALQSDVEQPSELETLMERYPYLRGKERGALVQLSNWQADRQLRQAHPEFAEYSKQRLSSYLYDLD